MQSGLAGPFDRPAIRLVIPFMLDFEIATMLRFAANTAQQIAAAELAADTCRIKEVADRWTRIADDHLWALEQIERLVPDTDLRAAYLRIRSADHVGDISALWAEIERRGLDL